MAEYMLAGRSLESPLFNAAGAINDFNSDEILRGARRLAKTGVGAIQGGSFTLPPSEGNEAKFGPQTHYYDEETGRMVNSKGLPNPGYEEALAISAEFVGIAHLAGKIAIYSASPTNAPEYGSSVDQALRLVEEFLETDVDLLIVNTSCPNVVTEGGGRKPILGLDYEAMEELVVRLWERVGNTGKLGFKPANHVSEEDLVIVPKLARLFRDYPVFNWQEGPNTIRDYLLLDKQGNPVLSVPGGKGGLSGPYTKENGREQLQMWDKLVGDFIDQVSTQGVGSGQEVAVRIKLKAKAASGVSFLWNSNDWGEAVTKMLDEFAEQAV
jgi:dihydroorotate dehydrogenase